MIRGGGGGNDRRGLLDQRENPCSGRRGLQGGDNLAPRGFFTDEVCARRTLKRDARLLRHIAMKVDVAPQIELGRERLGAAVARIDRLQPARVSLPD